MAYTDAMRYRDCGWCGVRDIAMDLRWNDDIRSARDTYGAWAIVTCPRCGGANLLQIHPSNHNSTEVIASVPSLGDAAEIEGVPEDVARYYGEAHIALGAGLVDAAAVELRKTLEGSAMHFADSEGAQIDSGNLVSRIERLIDAGHLPPPFREALHHVRQVGNIGAHAGGDQISPEDLRATMAFTTQTLRNLFQIPYLLSQLGGTADQAEPEPAPPVELDQS